MTACSRIEINPMIPVTYCSWVSLSHTTIQITSKPLYNLWATEEWQLVAWNRKLFAFIPTLASRDFAMSGKFSPLPAKWKHRRPNNIRVLKGQDYRLCRPSGGNSPQMVTRPRLPPKGLTLRWQPFQWLRLSLVRPLDGNALISALPGIKTMFLIVLKFISASSIFFYHFKVNDCRRKLHTLMTTNQLCQNLG